MPNWIRVTSPFHSQKTTSQGKNKSHINQFKAISAAPSRLELSPFCISLLHLSLDSNQHYVKSLVVLPYH